MKSLGVIASAFIALHSIGSASAGDHASTSFNWTGFYLGVHSGWTWQDAIADTGQRRSADGALLGVQAGVNYQFASNWVVGAEVDSAFVSAKGTVITPDPLVPHVVIADEIRADNSGSARLRLGYAFGRTLIYSTGGLAWGHGSFKVGFPGATLPAPAVIGSESNWHVGWAAGGGLETALARNWTAKVEYIYDSLGKETYLGTPARLEGQTVRVGVNFLFH